MTYEVTYIYIYSSIFKKKTNIIHTSRLKVKSMTIDKPLSVGISNFFIAAAGDSILIIFQLKQTPPEVYI